MYTIIDGKKISTQIKDELKQEVALLTEQGNRPNLAVIQVGNDSASSVYVNNKAKACEYIGIGSEVFRLDRDISQEGLIDLIDELNARNDIDGILVQLPLPDHIDEKSIINAISLDKDVDCFHPANVGKLVSGEGIFKPCTPAGIIQLLKRNNITIDSKRCVIIGRSTIVGKPMMNLMLDENATVTICHSHTKDLEKITSTADILIVAIGKPKYITANYVKEGAVVIDVGIHRMENKKLCGDVDFEGVKDKCTAITPVPGGVGPMTIAMLMKNCVESRKSRLT